MAEEQNKFASTSPDYQPSPAYLGGTIQENLTAKGMPEPLTFSKESLGQLTNIYRNENVADPTSALAQDIATTISGEFPEDPNWFSYPSLTTGKGFAGAFNDGIPMTPMDIIELFSVDTEGEPIRMPTLFGSEKLGTIALGVKEEIVPALAEAGSFAAGFKLTNDYLNRIKYKGSAIGPYFRGVQKGVSRFALPTVAGLFSATAGRFGGEKVRELTYGANVPLLPEAEALYKIGQGTTEGLGYSAIPYAMSKNISLGYELIKDDLTRGMLKQPGQQASKLFKYAPTATGKGTLASAESMLQGIAQTSKAAPFTYALAEGASNLGAGLAQAQNQLDPSVPVMEFAREFGYSLLGGYSADVLTKKVPYVAGQLNKGRKTVQGFVFGGKEFRDKAQAARQEKLQGEIADWLFKALQDAGEDPKEVAKLLNSREFSDLLDSDGSPVKPTAGTKSLSPTLLGLEGALNFIGNGLQGQRATAQQAITDGIRQKIRGLYATGDRDAVQEAAAMMEGTFEASINKRVYEARKNLDDAFKRIQKDSKGVPVAASKDEAKKMFELFDELIKADRARERALWKRIPENVEISEFVDGKGKPLSVPNFIKYWNENVSNLVKEAKIPLDNDLIDSLGAFVARKTDELNLSGEQAVVAVDTRLQKAREKFQDLYAGVAATPEAQAAFQRAVNEVSQLPPQEQAAAFKAISSDKLGKSSTPRSREVAKAYDAYANLLVIQNNLDTPPVAEASEAAAEVATSTADVGTLSSAELFDMRSTALADGRELAAQGKMDQARLAFGFADALLKDLESFPEGVNYNYDVARAYSKSFNDAYTRSFVSELLGTDKTGRQRIAPEMLKREFQNLDAAYLNTKQLDDIGQFQQQELLGNLIDGSQLEQTLLGAKSPIEGGLGSSDPRVVQLREGFETVINPESNMIDIPKYKNWLETNRELLNSVAPNLYESSKEVLQNGNTIRGTVENVLRNVREQAIDPDTNTITPKSLRLWMNSENNSQMLAAFPALKADLQSFERANVLLNENTKLSAERKRNIQAQTSFYELLRTTGTEKGGTENPTTAINHALSLSNKTPIKSLNALFAPIGMLDAKSKPLGDLTVSDPSRIEGATRDLTTGGSKDSVGYETALQGETSVVKIGPDSEGKLKVEPVTSATGRPVTVDREEALRGFRVSLIESVLGKAGANAGDGAWSATAAYKAMFEPLPNSQNELSVAEWAQSKGVMNAGQLSNMKKFLAEMVKYEQTLMKSSDGANLELMAKELSPGIDMALSIMGSAAGTQARSIFTGGQGGSGDLIVAGRGAEMFRKAGEKLLRQAPLTARTDILAAVLADPEAMADLIRKGKNPEEIESLRTKAVRWFSDLLDPSPSFARLSRPLITSGEEREYEAETEGGPSVLGSAIALAAPNFMSFGRTDSTTPLIDEVKRLATKEERQEAYRQEQLKRANEFLDSRSPQGARPPTTPPAETATSSSLPISSGSSGRTGSSETMQRGQALFPNDPIFRAFKRGGDVKAGIGGLFR